MERFGCLLFFLGIIGIFVGAFSIVLTDEALQIVEPLWCSPSERLIREATPIQRGSYSLSFICESTDGGERRSVNGAFTITLGVLLLPIVIAIVLMVAGSPGGQQGREQYQEAKGAYLAGVTIQAIDDDLTLSEKLDQIQEALDDGQISQAEYDTLRQRILENVADD